MYQPEGNSGLYRKLLHQKRETELFLSALRLNIFSHLEEWATAKMVAERTGFNERNLKFFLNALACIGLLEKHTNTYRNTSQSTGIPETCKSAYKKSFLMNGGKEMNLKKLLLPILSALLVLFFSICGQSLASTGQSPIAGVQETSVTISEVDKTRTITDLGGNIVNLPAADKIKRVVIISPPTTSILLSVISDTDMIVGVNSRAFTTANTEIISKIFPNWSNVETKFVSEGFVANTEELLNLNPDIVFYYGSSQKTGLENLGIPTVDFMMPGENNPEKVTIAWDNLMRQIFDVGDSISLKKEWEISNQKAQRILSTYTGEKKRALFIFSNIGGVITVSGSRTYADTWFKKSGLVNVAAKVKGQAEIDMEQLYEWDPDYIFVFIGNPAFKMLQNRIRGQDWSLLSAYRNKTIIDIPQAVYSWGAPCSDSPLMPFWLLSKSYSKLMGEADFKRLFHDYYSRMYGVELESKLITSILNPHSSSK